MLFRGVFPSLLTPFHPDGRVDMDAFRRHVRLMVDSRVDGMILCSTLGEGPNLEIAERTAMLQEALLLARPAGVPVIAAIVESSDAARGRWITEIRRLGADGALLFPPMQQRPTAAEFQAYLLETVRRLELPTMVFNKPAAFGCDVSLPTLEALCGEDAFQGIKEAAELTFRIGDWKARFGDRVKVFSGDEFALEALGMGADGMVAGLGNVVPAEIAAFMRAAKGGEAFSLLARRYRILAPLFQLDVSPVLVQLIKIAANTASGFPVHVRAPRQVLAESETVRVKALLHECRAAMQAAGLA